VAHVRACVLLARRAGSAWEWFDTCLRTMALGIRVLSFASVVNLAVATTASRREARFRRCASRLPASIGFIDGRLLHAQGAPPGDATEHSGGSVGWSIEWRVCALAGPAMKFEDGR